MINQQFISSQLWSLPSSEQIKPYSLVRCNVLALQPICSYMLCGVFFHTKKFVVKISDSVFVVGLLLILFYLYTHIHCILDIGHGIHLCLSVNNSSKTAIIRRSIYSVLNNRFIISGSKLFFHRSRLW